MLPDWPFGEFGFVLPALNHVLTSISTESKQSAPSKCTPRDSWLCTSSSPRPLDSGSLDLWGSPRGESVLPSTRASQTICGEETSFSRSIADRYFRKMQ